MYKKSDFNIGGSLFSIETDRHYKSRRINKHEITKIGNKYIEINKNSRQKILIKTLESKDYRGMFQSFYKTEQECEDLIEKEQLMDKVYWFCSTIRIQGLSLEQLRKINKIIDEIKGEVK